MRLHEDQAADTAEKAGSRILGGLAKALGSDASESHCPRMSDVDAAAVSPRMGV